MNFNENVSAGGCGRVCAPGRAPPARAAAAGTWCRTTRQGRNKVGNWVGECTGADLPLSFPAAFGLTSIVTGLPSTGQTPPVEVGRPAEGLLQFGGQSLSFYTRGTGKRCAVRRMVPISPTRALVPADQESSISFFTRV